jgi:hypothetical protein
MDIPGEVITNAQTEAKLPEPAPITLDGVDIDWNILKGFCMKYQVPLEDALKRFIQVDPETFEDADKRIVLMREQAKLSLDAMKAVIPKQVEHTGKNGAPIPLILTKEDASVL